MIDIAFLSKEEKTKIIFDLIRSEPDVVLQALKSYENSRSIDIESENIEFNIIVEEIFSKYDDVFRRLA